MITSLLRIGAALLVAAPALAASAQPAAAPPAAPRPPLVREGALQKVSERVWIIPDDSVPAVPNVGIVVGDRATLVVDTGMGERNGRTVLSEVGKVSRNRDIYIVSTHFHPEHDLGAPAFPAAAKMIRSTDQEKDIVEFGPQVVQTFAGRSPLFAELLSGATFRKADMVFEREQALDLGGVRVRILAMGANHTRGDTVVLVEPDGVLFTGDVAMKAQPAFSSPHSTIVTWLASLDRLEALKPKLIVPSHGPTGDVGLIRGYRDYLTAIRDRTAALKREGRTVEATLQVLTSEFQPRYPDAGRLGGAVRAAYAEAR